MHHRISQTPFFECVGICDDRHDLQGKSLWGMKVIGKINEIKLLLQNNVFDSAAIAVTSLPARKTIFEALKKEGVRLVNLIDPSVRIGNNVSIGEGNIILGQSRIGPHAQIGNNNFISSYANIEHHCILGNHCTFGPGVLTSGGVTIGDSVKFGTGIFIEPSVEIGEGATIASGITVTKSVEENHIVKRKV